MKEEDFLVVCGEWGDIVPVDRDIFESHEEACFEAATKSFEKYFKLGAVKERSLTTCVVRPAKAPNNKNDYLIFPPKLYENIGFHIITKYFERNNRS
jgi:hypothetical protein